MAVNARMNAQTDEEIVTDAQRTLRHLRAAAGAALIAGWSIEDIHAEVDAAIAETITMSRIRFTRERLAGLLGVPANIDDRYPPEDPVLVSVYAEMERERAAGGRPRLP